MKFIVISYSYTGNNDLLAVSVATALNAHHLRIKEKKSRSMPTIMMDMLFNRTPALEPIAENLDHYDLVIFMAPIWMGQVATPLRGYFKCLKPLKGRYAFVSISGGSEGENPDIEDELVRRLGKIPTVLIDKHIVDLLPMEDKHDRKAVTAYHLTATDIGKLTESIVQTIQQKVKHAELYK
jgi:multimeric flavodoxin WrbA